MSAASMPMNATATVSVRKTPVIAKVRSKIRSEASRSARFDRTTTSWLPTARSRTAAITAARSAPGTRSSARLEIRRSSQ